MFSLRIKSKPVLKARPSGPEAANDVHLTVGAEPTTQTNQVNEAKRRRVAALKCCGLVMIFAAIGLIIGLSVGLSKRTPVSCSIAYPMIVWLLLALRGVLY
jgi:hypothetical protein